MIEKSKQHKTYNLDDIVSMDKAEVKYLKNKYSTNETIRTLDESNSESHKKGDRLDLIFILDYHELFEFDGKYVNYVFGENKYNILDDYYDYYNISSEFIRLYRLYKQLYKLKNKSIKHVIIHTGYEYHLMDSKLAAKEELEEFKNDTTLIAVSDVYIKDQVEYDLIINELSSILTNYDGAKKYGIIYYSLSIENALIKAVELMITRFYVRLCITDIQKITYMSETETLILKYDCKSNKYYNLKN